VIWQLGEARQLDLSTRAHVMAILNVTPDSFYDGGQYQQADQAIERGLKIVAEGADVLDIGGQSSRPPLYGELIEVSAAQECARVVPVIEGIRRQSDVPISVDTTRALVARKALDAGADIVNDISAFTDDPDMLDVVASTGAALVLMHRRGRPQTMQTNTRYEDLLGEVLGFLTDRVDEAVAGGVIKQRLAVDPGLGFGKDTAGNLSLIRHVDVFTALGRPVVVGASRKSFIWKSLGLQAEEALEGSIAVAVLAAARGAHILRVHDVVETVRALRMAELVKGASVWDRSRPAPVAEPSQS
jgi:dihydropteroate synthase